MRASLVFICLFIGAVNATLEWHHLNLVGDVIKHIVLPAVGAQTVRQSAIDLVYGQADTVSLKCRQSQIGCMQTVCDHLMNHVANATAPHGCGAKGEGFNPHLCADEVTRHPLYAACIVNELNGCFTNGQLAALALALNQTEAKLLQRLNETATIRDLHNVEDRIAHNQQWLSAYLDLQSMETEQRLDKLAKQESVDGLQSAVNAIRDRDLRALQALAIAAQQRAELLEEQLRLVRTELATKANQSSIDKVRDEVQKRSSLEDRFFAFLDSIVDRTFGFWDASRSQILWALTIVAVLIVVCKFGLPRCPVPAPAESAPAVTAPVVPPPAPAVEAEPEVPVATAPEPMKLRRSPRNRRVPDEDSTPSRVREEELA